MNILHCPDGAKLISLTKGEFALVDEQDFDYLNQWKWHFKQSAIGGYACRIDLSTGFRVSVSMHRLVVSRFGEVEQGQDVDHINQNKIDNRRANLRCASRQQNAGNRPPTKKNKSGYKGVNLYDAERNVWRAQINDNGKKKSIGYYQSAEDAAIAYNVAAIKAFGEFAHLNKVEYRAVSKLENRTSKSYVQKGVSYHKHSKKWVCYTKQNGKRKYLGYFRLEEDAIRCYQNFIGGVSSHETYLKDSC